MSMPGPLRGAALTALMPGWLIGTAPTQADAEPWFAVDTGHRCTACHVNPTGGGKRTPYGNAFGQMQLHPRMPAEFWDPQFAGKFSVVWEYFPVAFAQLSLGARFSDGIPQNDNQNTDEIFAQLHIRY